MRSRRRSSGVSAVIGTAVAVMIFFTVMIPMWLYLQQLQTIFMDEVSRRLQFEVEKLNENLEVVLTMQPPDSLNRRFLFLIMMNKGPIEITVPALYIESNLKGLYPITDQQYKLAPGAISLMKLNYVVDPGEEVMLRAPTLRGNSFVSGETIGPNKLPYIMVVQLSNVSIGYRYRVHVSVVFDDAEKARGCVSLRGEEFAGGCIGEVVAERFISSVEEISEIFAFNIAPGIYEVRVAQCRYDGTGCANIAPSPVRVEANSHVMVQIDVKNRLGIPMPLPLSIAPLQNYTTVILSSDSKAAGVYIPFIVTLGNISEPLTNVAVSIELLSSDNLTATRVLASSQQISMISPGSSYIGFFVVEVEDEDEEGKYGGYFTYRLRIDSARGAITRDVYTAADGDFSLPSAEGVVYICRWWLESVVPPGIEPPGGGGGGVLETGVRLACRAP